MAPHIVRLDPYLHSKRDEKRPDRLQCACTAAQQCASTPPLPPHPPPQTLADAADVRPLLERRFGMRAWFQSHGYPASIWVQPQPAAAKPGAAPAASAAGAASAHRPPLPPGRKHVFAAARGAPAAAPAAVGAQKEVVLITDFDKTLTDWDAGAPRRGQAGRGQ